jgi:hypothetical protein
MEALKEFIARRVIRLSWGEFEGVRDLSLEDLAVLRVHVEVALAERLLEEMR